MKLLKPSNHKLGIGIPLSFPMVPAAFFHSFIMMERPKFVYLSASNGPVDEMRNRLVEQAQASGCSHLIMMDTDMIYHKKTITRLLSLRLPVVGALCYRRYPPFDPIMYRGKINEYEGITEWEKDGLVEVDATGTGCIMFDMRVFDRIDPPWFRFEQNPDQEVGGVIGEDIGFCSRLREVGYQIFVDTSVPAGHLTWMEINESSWRLYKGLKKIQGREKQNGA